ncbi:MAG: DNA repair protein RecO [Phycisphaerae bacterium]|nr:DNA repair protein RecO [Phycisphaerae bacterium]MBM92801.1 DNA repair protein RecO [Phycisphaerae bacterium]
MATIKDQAICVRHWDWSETSQTVSLMTREHGLLRCLAKGSKRERAPFSGGVEIATLGQLVAIIRPNSELVLLTQWDLSEPMYLLRTDLARYHAAMYAIDLIPRMINDHDPHPELYDALRETLEILGAAADCQPIDIDRTLLWYQWTLLVQIGSRPELRLDVRESKPIDAGSDVYGFHARFGGLTEDPGNSSEPDVWRVRRSTVDLLRRLDDAESLESLSGSSYADLTRAGALLALYIRTLVGQDIRSAHPLYPQMSRSI